MNKTLLSFAMACAATTTQAAQLEITVTNITGGNSFTPIVAAAHSSDIHLFKTGTMASEALAIQAEGGNPVPITDMVNASGYGMAEVAGGLTMAGQTSQTIMLDSMSYDYLSITSMILPTNDGFIGLDSWKIPTESGTYTLRINSYDAGTELNDEVINGGGALGVAGIPAAPGGQGGMGAMGIPGVMETNYIHPHPGVLGDFDAAGGYSDVNAAVHKWQDPIALVTVKVTADEPMNNYWSGDSVRYMYGDTVKFMGKYYQVMQAHTSQQDWNPEEAMSLFSEVGQ